MLVFWRCLWRCIRRCLHAQIFDHSVLYHSNYSAVAKISKLLPNLDHCSSHWHREELYFNISIFFQVQLLLLSFSTYFSPHLQWPHLLQDQKHFPCWFALSPSSSCSSCRQRGLFNHCKCCISLRILLLLPGLLLDAS